MKGLAVIGAAVAGAAMIGALTALSLTVIDADRAARREEVIRLALWRMDAEATAVILAEAAQGSERWLRDQTLPEPPLWLRACESSGSVSSPSAAHDDGRQRLAWLGSQLGGRLAESPPERLETVAQTKDAKRPPLADADAPADRIAQATRSPLERDVEAAHGSESWSAGSPAVDSKASRSSPLPDVDSKASRSSPLPGAKASGGAGPAQAAAKRSVAAAKEASVVQAETEAAYDYQARFGNSTRQRTQREEVAPTPAPPAIQKQDSQPAVLPPSSQARSVPPQPPRASAPPEAGPVVVQWLGDDLLLSRARSDGSRFLTVVRWQGWRAELESRVADVLPQARLRPVEADDRIRLAAIPVALDPGVLPSVPLAPATTRILQGSWAVGLAGLTAVLWAAWASVRLANRRAAFVSAVTHELRTPLTALRLHGDLLADPRIGDDPARRAAPVAAVRAGALRLSHLIDNVLDYARLERRKPQVRSVALGELLDGLEQRLPGIAMPEIPDLHIRCDPHAVDRILGNLADNAQKYGRPPFALAITSTRNRLRLALSDHGPGLAPDVRERLFAPFARSAEAAAGDAPGVGLGLALSRRLARAQGGELTLEPTPGGGVTAVLELRRA